MDRIKNHQGLVNTVLKELSLEFEKDLMIFKRIVGRFHYKRGGEIVIGITGQSDIYGFLKTKTHALPIEIEIKTGSAILSKAQEKWKKRCLELGVFFFVAREGNIKTLIEKLKEHSVR